MAPTLRQLESFIAIARTGSFSAAARIVHVSQPALTAVIKNLEQQLGVALFERTSRGVIATTAGRELLPSVERLLTELHDTLATLRHDTAPRGGRVSIACIPSAGSVFLPALIAGFNRRHPTVRVDVSDAMPENLGIVGLVRAGEADIGVASPCADALELQFRHLYDDALVALLPTDHPAAAGDSITWQQLGALPLIGMASRSHLRLLVDQSFAAIGVSKRPVIEVSLVTTAVGMARARIGAAVLPLAAVRSCDLNGLQQLAIIAPSVRRSVGFLYRSLGALSPAAKAFLAFHAEQRAGADLSGQARPSVTAPGA